MEEKPGYSGGASVSVDVIESDPPCPKTCNHRCLRHPVCRAPGTPKKHVKLPESDLVLTDSEPDSPVRRKCNPLCPGHRKHSLCEKDRRDGNSPRPRRHDETRLSDGSHHSRPKQRMSSPRKCSESPHNGKIRLHELVDEATDGGLGSRQYHSASRLCELQNREECGMKQRDFSMSHIPDRPLTEKELRLAPLRRSNPNSRSGSPLRTIRHSVRIERWDPVTDGELSIQTMMKKFGLTGFSQTICELKPGEILIKEISPEVRKTGLVSGKVWVKMYGRRINLVLGDILEIPANQAHRLCAEEGQGATLISGQKESCCIT